MLRAANMSRANPPLMRARLRQLFDEAVARVQPERLLPGELPCPPSGRLFVIAAGKAAAEMMRIVQARLGGACMIEGLVVTRGGHLPPASSAWQGVEIIEAGHPYPDQESLRAGELALEMASRLTEDDHLLALISGGGSALLAAPAQGLDLEEKQDVTRALLRSGARIDEINSVRKHLSRIKGGRLAEAAWPARVTTWLISDVPGDNPSFVASGPTIGDETTLEDAKRIIAKYRIVCSERITAALEHSANETPSPQCEKLANNETVIIGRASDALAAAESLAKAMGYEVTNLGDRLQGEARDLAREHANLALRIATGDHHQAIISGGETSVTVHNKAGRGGRNMEYLLSLAIALDGARGIYALACDTDGIDGTEDAAGAILLPDTLERAGAAGLDAAQHLEENNAYLFFEAIGDLVVTGPTLTNVNDFRVMLIEAEETNW
jgi:hydroxypyruvate reductase